MQRGFAGSAGQATVELALVLPFAALLVAALMELGLVAADQVRLWHAAREGARAAAVDPDGSDVLVAIRNAGVITDDVDISPDQGHRLPGEPVTVTIRYRRHAQVPVIGELLDVRLTASATMRLEVP